MKTAKDEHLLEIPIRRETVYAGRLLTVRRDVVRTPDGQEATREVIDHPGAVAILAVADDARICLVRQYRHATDRILLELPAGKLERVIPGQTEDPLEAAQRELAEECQLRARAWRRLLEFYLAAGYSSEKMTLFEAKGLEAVDARLDDDEFLEVTWMTPGEAIQAVQDGRIVDSKTIIGISCLLPGGWGG